MHKMELDPLLRVLCTLPYSLDDVRLFAQHFVFFFWKKETKKLPNCSVSRKFWPFLWFRERKWKRFRFINLILENMNIKMLFTVEIWFEKTKKVTTTKKTARCLKKNQIFECLVTYFVIHYLRTNIIFYSKLNYRTDKLLILKKKQFFFVSFQRLFMLIYLRFCVFVR